GNVGVRAQPGTRADLAVADRVPAADLLVARLELGNDVALLEPRPELRVPPARIGHQLRQPPQDDAELHRCEHGLLLPALPPLSSRADMVFSAVRRRHATAKAQQPTSDLRLMSMTSLCHGLRRRRRPTWRAASRTGLDRPRGAAPGCRRRRLVPWQ